jgi:hypothetical protein
MNGKTSLRPLLIVAKIGAAVLLVVGLFGLGVLLDQLAPPVQVINAQPVLSAPVSPPPASPQDGAAINGTLASFAALMPENMAAIYLPVINK